MLCICAEDFVGPLCEKRRKFECNVTLISPKRECEEPKYSIVIVN